MQIHKQLLLGALFFLSVLAAQAADSVRGHVVDENGKTLARVGWKISGIEDLNNGKWTRVHYSGIAAENLTDAEGSFVISFQSPRRFDLQFHKPGFAPTFVYEVTADSPELKVTLKRGESIHGTVTHLVDGKPKPLLGETVELRLPAWDFWYQERVITDMDGKFEFRACAPPDEPTIPPGNFFGSTTNQDSQPKWKWQLVCAGKIIQVDVKDGKAVEAVDFEIEAEAKKHTP
jgi:hypothetical protein